MKISGPISYKPSMAAEADKQVFRAPTYRWLRACDQSLNKYISAKPASSVSTVEWQVLRGLLTLAQYSACGSFRQRRGTTPDP